jgi:hypothetical protein
MRACNWQVNRPCAECFASMARTTIAGEPKPLARSACPPRSGHSATTGLVLRHDRSGAATRQVWCCDTTGLVLRHDLSARDRGAAVVPLVAARQWVSGFVHWYNKRTASEASRTPLQHSATVANALVMTHAQLKSHRLRHAQSGARSACNQT